VLNQLKQFNPLHIVIVILVVIILLQRGCANAKAPQIITKIDTVTQIKYESVIKYGHSKPIYIKAERDSTLQTETEYILSEIDSDISERFDTLVELYSMKNIYLDSIKIDTFGYVTLTDTIQQNKFLGRSFITNIVIPEKTVTINKTITLPPVRQLYLGAGLMGNRLSLINSASAGILYKDKQDRIFGASVGVSNNQLSYGISSYWKIKL
jgi:hypothetical protein